ncbi:MAG: hypothetical protein JOZ26_25425 [Hyphomicrobiales bacterium]|nr:hypothetical protein [Hyphomicrobiales bacterium]
MAETDMRSWWRFDCLGDDKGHGGLPIFGHALPQAYRLTDADLGPQRTFGNEKDAAAPQQLQRLSAARNRSGVKIILEK